MAPTFKEATQGASDFNTWCTSVAFVAGISWSVFKSTQAGIAFYKKMRGEKPTDLEEQAFDSAAQDPKGKAFLAKAEEHAKKEGDQAGADKISEARKKSQ